MSHQRLIIRLAIAAAVALLALGFLPASGPASLQAQGADGHGKRIDVRLLTNTDDWEQPSPSQLAALGQVSQRVGGMLQADFNPLNGTPRVLFAPGSFLSEPSADSPRAVATDFLLENADLFSVSPQFVSRLAESRVFTNDNSGITHVQYEQRYDGLKVFQSTVRVAVTDEGSVLTATADYYPELSLPSTIPALSREAAMDAAFAEVGPPRDLPPAEAEPDPTAASLRDFYTPSAELVVFPLPNKDATLAWRVEVPQAIDFWDVVVDADDGAVLYVANLTNEDQGQVFVEHPDAGSQVTVQFPPSGEALPVPRNVWVGPNVDTTCTTCTAGNNVSALSDRDTGDGTASFAYDPAADFSFGFANSWRSSANPDPDEAASVTNLFYLNNVAHDHFYQLGFTEAAGNFQDDNFGAGGVAGDPVYALTNTGVDNCTFSPPFHTCRNNAFFSTPSDGTYGLMVMFMFTSPAYSDPSFDGDVVIHEYTHGVSSRLVGPGTLNGTQSGAMGEGWSDYFPLSLYDDPVSGEYVTQNPTTGIRNYAYDNNPLTYGDLCAGGCEVHDDGEIWGAALWDLRDFYIAELGAGPGAQAADELVIEGLMLTPTNPSMLEARDAILQAEQAMGGANQCDIWQVFADRGMGHSATTTGDTATVSEAFDTMPACNLNSAPGAVSWDDDRIDVFARASDNGVWHKPYALGSGWSEWRDLAGTLNSGPDASSRGKGRLDVFAVGTDSKLWHKTYVWGHGWSGWRALGAPAGKTLTSDPSAVSWSDGRIDVFARADDNSVWHKSYAEGHGWSIWESLGGTLNSGPDASSRGTGRLDVFAVGTDNNLWHKTYVWGHGWSGWRAVGAPAGKTLTSDPSAVSWSDGRIDVFARASDNGLWHKSYVQGAGWSVWESLGGTLNSGTDASSRGTGRLDVFVLGTDDNLWHKTYVWGHGWSGWRRL